MKILKTSGMLLLLFSMGITPMNAQQTTQPMKTYLIEREIIDAGNLTQEQLKGISQKSCSVLDEMGSDIQWITSYVVQDKVYCIYRAKNEALIKEHAEKGGFPANSISELTAKIGPETAENN